MNSELIAQAFSKVPPEMLEGIIEYVGSLSLPEKDHAAKLKLALENVRLYYNEILPKMMESTEPKVQEIIDLLVDSCLIEKNFEEALLHFAEQVHARGFEIEIEPEKFRNWVDKLSNIRLYRKVIHAMGLGAFEDELMRVEIEKTMAPRLTPPPTAPPSRGRNKT